MGNTTEKLSLDDFDLNLDLGIADKRKEEEILELDELINRKKIELELINLDIISKQEEFSNITPYLGGFKNLLHKSLNTTYHTMTLVGFMFTGYFITGIKYMGLKIWKSPTTITFYLAFFIGFIILTTLEYLRSKGVDSSEQPTVNREQHKEIF